jgi:hypothetical protein
MVPGSVSKAASLIEATTGLAKSCGTLELCGASRKTKMRESASNQSGGVEPSSRRESRLKSFLLLNIEIQWLREGLWLDGVEASGKLFDYPA